MSESLSVTTHLCGVIFFGFDGLYLLKSWGGGKRVFRRMSSVHHSRPCSSAKTVKLTAFASMLAETFCHVGASR